MILLYYNISIIVHSHVSNYTAYSLSEDLKSNKVKFIFLQLSILVS